jgi:hypothetical protein
MKQLELYHLFLDCQPFGSPSLKTGACSGLTLSGDFSPVLKDRAWRRRMGQVTFTPYNPKSPRLETGDEGNFKFKDKEKPFALGRGYTGSMRVLRKYFLRPGDS